MQPTIKTITRDPILDRLPCEEAAARVDTFIGTPQQTGPWHIDEFEVDEAGAAFNQAREQYGDSPGRTVPVGTYLKLWREAGLDDRFDEDGEPKPYIMMSNTPDEISDHADAFVRAKGDVLVHGLGLSCVVSGLLANPNVRHIDVVDLAEDVIEMVAPGYANEDRVTIHHGDALTYEWPAGKRWDYAWHDIWALISDGNLNPVEAENGIDYFTLFDRFRDRCERQDAWAFLRALRMKQAGVLADDSMREWQQRWRDADVEGRVLLVAEFHAFTARGMDTDPSMYMRLFQMSGMADEIRERAEQSDKQFFFVPDHLMYEEAEKQVTYLDAADYIKGRRTFTPTPPHPFLDDEDQEAFEKAMAGKDPSRSVAIGRVMS